VIGNPRTMMIGTSNHYAAIFTNTVALAPRRLKEWELDVGGTAINSFSRVLPTGDGGYLLVGTSDSGVSGNKQSAGFGNADYWIVKADASGNRQWEKALGGSQQDQVTDAIITADGGYLIAGDSYSATDGNKTSPGFGNADYWVVKLDPTGTKQWEQTFGGSGEDHLSSVSQTSDGGYILGGYSNSGRSGNKTTDSFGSHDYWLIKVDHDGVRQWEQVYGGSQSDELYRVLTTIDGGYLLGGYSYSGIDGNKKAQNRGGSDIWVVKTDGQGRMQWQQTYGGDSDESLGDLATSSDGGYFVGASSKSGISGNKTTPRYGYPDIWVFKTDGNGVQQWDQSYGNSGASSLNRLQL